MTVEQHDRLAIQAALDAKLVIRCPLHPEELVGVGAGGDPAKVPNGLEAAVRRVVESAPSVCQQCMDRDD